MFLVSKDNSINLALFLLLPWITEVYKVLWQQHSAPQETLVDKHAKPPSNPLGQMAVASLD